VPVLPSLITLGNLFFGFLAMAKCTDALIIQGAAAVLSVDAMRLFEVAAIFVFVAMVFDGLDGAVARLTNQATEFGGQLDSLADIVTFGVAPAFIAKALVDFYSRADVAVLPYHPKIYWAAAAIFVLCAAMRLARYNVEMVDDDRDHHDFVGLPTPAAAAVLCSIVAFYASQGDAGSSISQWMLPPETYSWLIRALPVSLVLLGLLMISRFPFPHVVATVVRGRHSFPFLGTLVVVLFAAAIEWQFALLLVSVTYVVVGILLGLFRLVTRARMDGRDPEDDVGDFGDATGPRGATFDEP